MEAPPEDRSATSGEVLMEPVRRHQSFPEHQLCMSIKLRLSSVAHAPIRGVFEALSNALCAFRRLANNVPRESRLTNTQHRERERSCKVSQAQSAKRHRP